MVTVEPISADCDVGMTRSADVPTVTTAASLRRSRRAIHELTNSCRLSNEKLLLPYLFVLLTVVTGMSSTVGTMTYDKKLQMNGRSEQ